jgi:Carboxypeptidase regulatory-like domain
VSWGGLRWKPALAVGFAAAAAGCGVQTLSYSSPPAVTAPPVTPGPTLPDNLPSVAEARVPGAAATPPLPIGPGTASLNGTVLGPQGPVPGATVQAERIVGNQVATAQTTTAADGSWTISSILGGRYRVRAWQAPGLAAISPQIFFLGGTQSDALTIQVTSFTGPVVAAAIAPAVPAVDQPSNLEVQVTTPTVGSDGVVRDLPDAGVDVTLTEDPLWQVQSANPSPTGPEGTVLFQISCQAAGTSPLSAAVGNGAPQALQVPDCVGAPTTTTTPTTIPTTTTTAPATTVPATTTTTCPPAVPGSPRTTVDFGVC